MIRPSTLKNSTSPPNSWCGAASLRFQQNLHPNHRHARRTAILSSLRCRITNSKPRSRCHPHRAQCRFGLPPEFLSRGKSRNTFNARASTNPQVINSPCTYRFARCIEERQNSLHICTLGWRTIYVQLKKPASCPSQEPPCPTSPSRSIRTPIGPPAYGAPSTIPASPTW